MTRTAISATIDHVRARLVENQAADAQHYTDAHVCLGRARHATELGDPEACEQRVVKAEEEEHAVTGAVDFCAAVFQVQNGG